MATYLDREQISHRRTIQRRYDADQQRMAALIAFILSQYARIGPDGKRTIPTDQRTRLAIKAAIWAQVLKPYYIGQGTDAFNADQPQSPFAQLIRDGVEGATRIQVQRQQSLFKRYIKDATIISWFFAPNQNVTLPKIKQANYQQPFWAYTDPNGYKLNDRIQRNAVDSRAKLDRMLDYHVAQGTPVDTLNGKISNFMTISGRSTGKAYGEYGSYAAWLLLRTEMVRAAGRATVIGSELNPVTDRIWWRLSTGHNEVDDCDNNASGGPNGDGIYPNDEVPAYPNHPGELCSLVPVTDENMDLIRRKVETYIRSENDIALRWHGTMDEESLVRSLMTEEYRQANPLTGQNLRGVPAVRLTPYRPLKVGP